MSNSKKAVQEIKNLLKQFGFFTEEIALLSFKLSDNTILQTEKLEAGFKINKINEAFEVVSLEDGEYRLMENFNIVVSNGEITEVKEIFLDAKLKDGTVLKIEGDMLAEGCKVVVVTADAELPAPDGTHELEDGTKIETKDGVIAVVTEVPGDVEEGETPEAPELEVPAIDEPMKMGDPVKMDGELMDMLKEFIGKCGEKLNQMEQSYNSLQNEFNEFKKQPAGKKIADGKTENFTKINNDDDTLNNRIAMLKALKNNN